MSGKVVNVVKKDFFRDSLQLMRITDEAKRVLKGITDVAVVMGTTTNKDMLRDIGMLDDEGEKAGPSDTLIAIKLEETTSIEEVVRSVEGLLAEPARTSAVGESVSGPYSSVEDALKELPDANLALISVPGRYVLEVAMPLLEKGVNVHIFSDHVPVRDEVELKSYAAQRNLLVLGPGAGTSLISGVGIAFSNRVRRGGVGIVAAAGTGLQELSVLVDRAGSGVSHGLGVGGGDVKAGVGGIMSKVCIERLGRDPETKIMCYVSKPPSKEVSKDLLEFFGSKVKKPGVVCFVGGSAENSVPGNVFLAETLHTAASKCVELMGGGSLIGTPREQLESTWKSASFRLGENQRYVRGLFTGGTLMYESLVITSELLGEVWSNAPIDPSRKLGDHRESRGHTLVDMGEEEFTEGRPHPMIDPTLRKLRLLEEAKDPEVGVIMMDFVLGFGSHSDPAGAMSDAIVKANQIAASDGRQLVILGHVCGTEQDPQVLSAQESKLREVGVILFPTNAEMAFSAAMIARRDIMGQKTYSDEKAHEVSSKAKRFLGGGW